MTKDQLIYRMNAGEILTNLIPVESNVFNIPERLREIDPGYFVMFNPNDQKYELHHEDQDITYCLTFPFDELDSRALDYARETSIQRYEQIRREMEKHNEMVERHKKQDFDDKVDYISKEIHRSALRRNEVPDAGAFKTKWY